MNITWTNQKHVCELIVASSAFALFCTILYILIKLIFYQIIPCKWVDYVQIFYLKHEVIK